MMHTFTLLIVNESLTSGYEPGALNFIYLASTFAAIWVITSKNPIVSVLFLIGLFLSIACYLFFLGLNFIALSYLLVYVGAVSILFLFILMLINVRISELSTSASNTIPLALTIAVYFNYPIYDILPRHLSYTGFIGGLNVKDHLLLFELDESYKSFNFKNEIAYVSSCLWDGNLAEATHITSIGNIMYTSYSIWLIITSVILLLAMVGAIVITIKQTN